MTLPFSTQIKPPKGTWYTYFPEKILTGFLLEDLAPTTGQYTAHPSIDAGMLGVVHPKLHTLRDDLCDRWQVGRIIHFATGNQTKHYRQFAPIIPVVSIQQVQVKWTNLGTTNRQMQIFIDGRQLDLPEITKLWRNDGFDKLQDFMNYFPQNWKGKLIHWTNLKY